MKSPTMEAGVRCDQGYESYDSLSACGSERKSSLSDAEFDPISDDDEDDDDGYSKPALEDPDMDDLSAQLNGATLVPRAPMKNIDNVRDMRRESAQPWSVRTQNAVTPSGGRVTRIVDQNTSYMLQNYERIYNNGPHAQNVLTTGQLQTQNILTGNLHTMQQQNIITRTARPQNVMTSNNLNITNNITSNNILSKNLTSNTFLGKNLTNNNNNIYTSGNGVGGGKVLPNYEAATRTNVPPPSANLIKINIQPPSVSSEELLKDELPDLNDYPELQDFAKFSTEEENSNGTTDYSEFIRHLFTDPLPELSAADVNEGFGQLEKIDFGKISPLSFSSTIIPPSIDSYPSSPIDCDLLSALSDQEVLPLNVSVDDVSVVPDFISILRASSDTTGNPVTTSSVPSTNYTSLATTYTAASTVDYSTYTSSTGSSFLDIRDHRGSFSTSSTPSHPGSVEYSPQSSADSGSDPELSQQFSPNIIPVTVNDDLGDDEGSRSRASSRLDNTGAKERLLQRIRADVALKKAKDAAWLAASRSAPEKLIIAIQDLCGSVDHSVEAKFYANMEVFIDNATQEQIVQLFESVRFQRCANVVNNPLLSAYVCEIMVNRGLE